MEQRARERLNRSRATLQRWAAQLEEVGRLLGELHAHVSDEPHQERQLMALRERLRRHQEQLAALRDEIERSDGSHEGP